MQRTDLSRAAQQLLTHSSYATIATVNPDGHPWNTPVYGCFDANLNFYWASWTDNQHSRNIARDPRIFVTLYDSTAPEGSGYGLYFKMIGRQLSDPLDLQRARQVYTTTFGESGQHAPFTGKCPRRLYQAAPSDIWENTDSYLNGNFIDTRRPLASNR